MENLNLSSEKFEPVISEPIEIDRLAFRKSQRAADKKLAGGRPAPLREEIKMANCKICGHPVIAGPVMHGECSEQLVTEAAEKFCDNYCVWMDRCDSQKQLWEEHCNGCPMEQLMKLIK